MGISGSRLEGAKPTETHGNDEHGSQYDPHFTDNVISATGRNANPRLSQIMPALLRHMHDFAREVDLTTAEWMAGVEMVSVLALLSTSPVFFSLQLHGSNMNPFRTGAGT
ncbi:putative hydroxyquinol -dioxygenase [Rosellinia necatrix]|uniref:Putative hydroxyquinol-dioxygenase n=1 Tax=Rosellinia necatrix TaxID=77044 RepID=A0A1S8A933_ROSNE|nr:putative hydroxyquinol -dioxygenase [Rosellinia necatrix]